MPVMTFGGREILKDNDFSLKDTEPPENFEEYTPCGCSYQKYIKSGFGNPQSQPISVIPSQNIQKLRQTQSFITMRKMIERHLENYVRRRMLLKNKHT